MKNLMNKKELCAATNGKLTMWTIGELTRRGTMPVVKIPGMRLYLYDFDAVTEWLQGLENIKPAESAGYGKLRAVK
jgi:hypothetical protein